METLHYIKYRRKDEVLGDLSAVWEIIGLPGIQIYREDNESRCRWKAILSPGVSIKRVLRCNDQGLLSNQEQHAIRLWSILKSNRFNTRRETMQAVQSACIVLDQINSQAN